MAHDNPKSRIRNLTWLCLALVMALGAFLLAYRLGEKSYWDDEASAVLHARLPLDGSFLSHDPYNPPLFFVLLHFWRQFGEEEWRLRLLPVLFGFLSIPMLFFLARRIAGSSSGLAAAFMLAIAPAFVLYCREVRPYSMLCLFSLLSTWLLIVCLDAGKERSSRFPTEGSRGVGLCPGETTAGTGKLTAFWLLYGLACGAGLAVHHSFLLVFAVHQVFAAGTTVLLRLRAKTRPRDTAMTCGWLLSLSVMVLTLLPWAPVCAANLHYLLDRATGAESFAIPYGAVGRLGYMAYVFSLGETVLPWRWTVAIPAALAFGFLFFMGMFSLFRSRGVQGGRETGSRDLAPAPCGPLCSRERLDPGESLRRNSDLTGNPRAIVLPLVALVFPCVVFAFSSHGAPRYVFGSLPFYMVLCAVGFCSRARVAGLGHAFDPHPRALARGAGEFRSRALAIAALTIVAITNATGLANYFIGRDFHNMAYVEPTREVVAQMLDSSRSGDLVVLSQPSRPFALYLKDRLAILFLLHTHEGVPKVWGSMAGSDSIVPSGSGDSVDLTPDEFIRRVRREGRRVWFVRRSPGRIGSGSEVLSENDEFERFLNTRLRKRLHWRVCFDPEAPTKRLWIKAKPFMEYRIEVTLYSSE